METEKVLAEVGSRLAQARQNQGLSLTEAAGMAHVSARYLRMAEAGQANLSLLKLTSLAKALRLPLGQLCDIDLTGPSTRFALLGVRGCGKTTVGKRLAKRLKVPFVELDQCIEDLAGMNLTQIFSIHGEPYYQQLQREALEKWLARSGSGVLATGGNIVSDPQLYERLRNTCRTIWLDTPADLLMQRVIDQGDLRPMADRPRAMGQLRSLLSNRQDRYALADLQLATAKTEPDRLVDQLVQWAEA